MRRILSLAVALVILFSMSVTAFAATSITWKPYELQKGNTQPKQTNVLPGESFPIPLEDFPDCVFVDQLGNPWNDGYRSYNNGATPAPPNSVLPTGQRPQIGDYYIVNKLREPTKNAVEYMKFNDEGTAIIVKLKPNYYLTAHDLRGSIELHPKSTASTVYRTIFTWSPQNVSPNQYVNLHHEKTYGFAVAQLNSQDDLIFNYTEEIKGWMENPIVSNAGDDAIVDFGKLMGTTQISWGRIFSRNAFAEDCEFYYEGKVVNQGRLFLGYNNRADKNILDRYVPDDQMINVDFATFPAFPTFDFTGTARIFSDNPQLFIYENKSGYLYRINATYDADEESYSWKTRTLGSYVISDQELTLLEDNVHEVLNPNTGR